jgi:hypothetical protein
LRYFLRTSQQAAFSVFQLLPYLVHHRSANGMKINMPHSQAVVKSHGHLSKYSFYRQQQEELRLSSYQLIIGNNSL